MALPTERSAYAGIAGTALSDRFEHSFLGVLRTKQD